MPKFSLFLFVCFTMAMLFVTACSDSDDATDNGIDGDEESSDGDGEDEETDGDAEQEIAEPPDEQPEPEGEADLEFVFDSQNLSLKNWRVRDESEELFGIGSSHWTVIDEGLVQWLDMASTAEKDPDENSSKFLSTELRNESNAISASAIKLDFTVGPVSAGIGFSLGDGEQQVLLCLNEELCGSKFARWLSSGETLMLESNDAEFGEGERYSLLLTVQDGWGMLSLDGNRLLAVPIDHSDEGAIGILNYMMEHLIVHSISIWGEVVGSRPRPEVEWSVIAHRGHGNSRESNALPENTVEACIQGHADGADYLEVDVLLSLDDIPVLMHDDTLDRTTNCTGKVKDKTFEELQDCRIEDESSYFGDPIFVQGLEEGLQRAPDAKWFIELKSTGSGESNQVLAQTVVSLMQQYEIEDSYVISFNLEMLELVEELNSGINTAYVVSVLSRDHIAKATDAGVDAVDAGFVTTEESIVADAHDAGLKYFIWTADNQTDFEKYLEMGIDGITTNNPDRLYSSAYAK